MALLGAADLNPFSRNDEECTLCLGCSSVSRVLPRPSLLSGEVQSTAASLEQDNDHDNPFFLVLSSKQ